jgi:hypothetical protein
MTEPHGERREGTPFRPLLAALALIAAGLPGIAALLFVLPPVAGVPPPLLLVNPLVLLILLALIGAWAAPRAGLSSRIAARASGLDISLLPESSARLLALGAGAGLLVALLDHFTRGLWQAWPSSPPSLAEGWSLAALLVGILYGGVVEEVTMRWGLMSLFVFIAWKAMARQAPTPPSFVLWTGIVLAALVFAAGHLPVLAASGVELTPALLFRTLFWNGLLGLLFGWLYATRDLESAMLAHAGFHIGLVPVGVVMAG